MTKRIDAAKVALSGRRVLFDTNIWLFLHGFSNANPAKTNAYSAAHKQLLQNDNSIIVNDYVLAEFCNRSCKIEYETLRSAAGTDGSFPHYKQYRKSAEFAPVMESVRDTCLNIIDDCEFSPVGGGHYAITNILNRYCDGVLDFSDLILADFCLAEQLVLMTDDADFRCCDFDIISANPRLLR